MRIANNCRGLIIGGKTTEKKRCEGTIGDNKSTDRLEVRSCAVKEVKGTPGNGEVMKNKNRAEISKLVPG